MSERKTYLTDEELEHFKNLLLKQKKDMLSFIEEGKSNLRVDSDELLDEGDFASDEWEKMISLRMVDRDKKLLHRLDKALEKIQNKTYGICDECGKPISKERLEVRPVAFLCIDCKSKQEKKERSIERIQDPKKKKTEN